MQMQHGNASNYGIISLNTVHAQTHLASAEFAKQEPSWCGPAWQPVVTTARDSRDTTCQFQRMRCKAASCRSIYVAAVSRRRCRCTCSSYRHLPFAKLAVSAAAPHPAAVRLCMIHGANCICTSRRATVPCEAPIATDPPGIVDQHGLPNAATWWLLRRPMRGPVLLPKSRRLSKILALAWPKRRVKRVYKARVPMGHYMLSVK